MIKNNKFFIENLKTIVIISSHQSNRIDKKINYKIFDKLNINFKNFIEKNTKIKNTIFVGIAARFIFKKNTINKFFQRATELFLIPGV